MMAHIKAIFAVCLVGLTAGAPQLFPLRGEPTAGVAAAPQLLNHRGGPTAATADSFSLSGISEQQVVSEVVTALTPSIQAAVERALAGHGQAQAQVGTAQQGLPLLQRQPVDTASSFSAGPYDASPFATGSDELAQSPKYNYEYKISDDEAQTYITQSEARDGDDLKGTYSYVDAKGALVTVNYEAGPEGYSETREEQPGFVNVRDQTNKGSTESSSSGLDQATIIERIITELKPEIENAVSSALDSQRAAAESQRRAAAAEAQRRAAEEAQRRAAEEAQRRAAEEAQRRAAAEAERRAAAEAQRRAAAEAERRAAEAAARAEQQRLASGAATRGGGLGDVFGEDGKAYNVKVQTPQFAYQY